MAVYLQPASQRNQHDEDARARPTAWHPSILPCMLIKNGKFTVTQFAENGTVALDSGLPVPHQHPIHPSSHPTSPSVAHISLCQPRAFHTHSPCPEWNPFPVEGGQTNTQTDWVPRHTHCSDAHTQSLYTYLHKLSITEKDHKTWPKNCIGTIVCHEERRQHRPSKTLRTNLRARAFVFQFVDSMCCSLCREHRPMLEHANIFLD